MGTRVGRVTVDSEDPPIQAMWWAAALGWHRSPAAQDGWYVHPHPGEPGLPFLFLAVPEPKTRPNRLHWALSTSSPDEFDGQVEALRRGGARRGEIARGEGPWYVLTDPEGNEFCVLEPRDGSGKVGPVAAVVIPALDPHALAGFWEQALGWQRADRDLPGLCDPSRTGPRLEFAPASSPPPAIDRVRLDLVPTAGSSREAQTGRLLDGGARRVDIGQDDALWDVLADPEGNIFRVLDDDGRP